VAADGSAFWVDLLDPQRAEVSASAPTSLLPMALDELAAATRPGEEPRPTIESHGAYVLGIFLVPVDVPGEDRLFYQEIDLVATAEGVLTVRKSPGNDPALPAAELQEIVDACQGGAGRLVHLLVDEIAERFLQVIDAIEDEIDEIEEGIGVWSTDRIQRHAVDVRRSIIHLRRTLAPTRDAVRRAVDGRITVHGWPDVFPHEVQLGFGDSYDKLLRATEGLDAARDLLASVRDYHQAKIAETQNDVVKMLTVIASIVLVPSFVVGFYGQNFASAFGSGYWTIWMSTGLILASTILQLALFRWRRWI
jgi:magnesium transporter